MENIDTESVEYKISVMQAFKEGKEIETKYKGESINKLEWFTNSCPVWNWRWYNYRVKESPDYRPYETKAEFLNAQKQHGIYLCNKKSKNYCFPTSVSNGGIEITVMGDSITYGWDLLFKNFVWQDETPCGTLK